jgi:hypothetical protein
MMQKQRIYLNKASINLFISYIMEVFFYICINNKLQAIKNNKMKRILFISISVVFFLISCQNSSESSVELDKNIQTDEQVENIFFYVEFINLDSTSESINPFEQVRKELFNNGYILGKETSNDWQGIRKIDATEHIMLQDIDKDHPNIHRFRDFSEYDSSNGDIEKIVITLNNPVNDTIPNFNFRTYKKLGHNDWQSVSNPGNFRYTESNNPTETDLANWMIEHIVLLTFK